MVRKYLVINQKSWYHVITLSGMEEHLGWKLHIIKLPLKNPSLHEFNRAHFFSQTFKAVTFQMVPEGRCALLGPSCMKIKNTCITLSQVSGAYRVSSRFLLMMLFALQVWQSLSHQHSIDSRHSFLSSLNSYQKLLLEPFFFFPNESLKIWSSLKVSALPGKSH